MLGLKGVQHIDANHPKAQAPKAKECTPKWQLLIIAKAIREAADDGYTQRSSGESALTYSGKWLTAEAELESTVSSLPWKEHVEAQINLQLKVSANGMPRERLDAPEDAPEKKDKE
jgi:hypothetical protein